MLMIWSARCTFHTRMRSELEFLSALGLIISRAPWAAGSPRGQGLAVLPSPARALLGGCGVRGGGAGRGGRGVRAFVGKEGP